MIAAWAIREGLWQVPRTSAVDQLASDIARSMREEFITDPQGRSVRLYHARRVTEKLDDGEERQMVLWDDIRNAPPEHMQISFQQRRHAVLGDVIQLERDVASYNDNYNSGPQLQFSYNYEEDLAELKLPTDYPSGEYDSSFEGK